MFRHLPPVIKNFILLNVLMLFASWLFRYQFGIDLNDRLGFHYFESNQFRPYQLVTYMFMHGGMVHLFFNMYALFIFGVMLEHTWGSKRFFTYYILCGIGAIGVQALVNFLQISHIRAEFSQLLSSYSPSLFLEFAEKNFPFFDFSPGSPNFTLIMNTAASEAPLRLNEMLQLQMAIPTVGASGAVYGILLAFGMMFPRVQLMLLIPPIPIQARWLVIIYGLIELTLGISQPGSNVAHFAHLGGMIIGFILIKIWQHRHPHYPF